MFKPLLFLPAVLILGYYSAPLEASNPQANAAAPSAAAKTAGKASTEIPAHVKKIYAVDCALCHGANGDGKTDLAVDMKLGLGDFTNPKTLDSKTDQQLFDVIRKGKDKMPPEEEGRAKNEDVRHLIAYLRSMSKDQPAPAPVAAPADPADSDAPTTAAPGTN